MTNYLLLVVPKGIYEDKLQNNEDQGEPVVSITLYPPRLYDTEN